MSASPDAPHATRRHGLDRFWRYAGRTGLSLFQPPARLPGSPGAPLPAPFDPATSATTFRLGLAPCLAPALLPPLVDTLREAAPGATLLLPPEGTRPVQELLAQEEVATCLTLAGTPGPHQRRLGDAGWVVLRDAQTPPVDRLDAFCARPHLRLAVPGAVADPVDRGLAALGRDRPVRLVLPLAGLVAATLRGTDLVAVVPDWLARQMPPAAGLCADRPPLALEPLSVWLAWSPATDRDPAEAWFRAMVARCLGPVLATQAPSRPGPQLLPVARAA
jgi:LysR family transcriptional activator of mexEF-oprN operon